MKNIRRFFTLVLTAVIMLTFTACSSFQYDKDAAIKRAKEIVAVTNTRDYQAVVDMLPESMQKDVTADSLKASWDTMLTDSGAFVEYISTPTSGITQNGVNYIVVIVTGKYENSNRTFTISFTTDMDIAGLYLK